MLQPRKLFGVCYLNEAIYVIGGQTLKSKFDNSCECFDFRTKKWRQIANLNEGVSRPSVCNLNGNYIFKFGGINKFDVIDKSIERYDPI